MREIINNASALTPILAFIITAAAAVFIIPTVVKIAKIKKLVDVPNGRSSHKSSVPSLGGFAVFLPLSVVVLLLVDFTQYFHLQIFIVGIFIMAFVGIKDDIIDIDPLKKLVAQMLAASLLVLVGGLQLTTLHGFLGIESIHPFAGAILTIFVILVITNSFNLIDGIDGLASGVGILASLTFGVYFVLIGEVQLAILSFAIIGGFAAFFFFNISHGKNKIFMGDTGSLILGFSLAYLTIQFNELNVVSQPYQIASAPAVSFGILIVPLFDTLRVFLIRAINGKSPFSPDKLHVHHRLLFLKKSHKKATFTILTFNAGFIILVLLFQNIGILYLVVSEIALALFFSYLPIYFIRRMEYKKLTTFEKEQYEALTGKEKWDYNRMNIDHLIYQKEKTNVTKSYNSVES